MYALPHSHRPYPLQIPWQTLPFVLLPACAAVCSLSPVAVPLPCCCPLVTPASPSAATCRSRLGCQILASKELDGLVVRIPSATRNMAVDGFRPKPH